MASLAVNLWILIPPNNDDLQNRLQAQLGAAQRQQIKFLSATRQKTFCYSRALLLYALNSVYTNTNDQWTITERRDLPPMVRKEGITPKFSISHSGNTIGLAIANAKVTAKTLLGLDIELINAKRKLETADYFCNDQQLCDMHKLANADQKRRYLTRLWTQKEAYFKAHQMSILNPELKSLAFNKLDRTMLTANLSEIGQVSVYCDAPMQIKTNLLAINEHGAIYQTTRSDLDWQSYGIEYSPD